MAESFRASFVLALKDDLSAGLQKIIRETKQLRDLAKSLGFKPLEGAGDIVNRVDRDVVQLNRSLGATARQAEAATGAFRRMGAAELGRVREQAQQMQMGRRVSEQLGAGRTLGQVYGPGGIPLLSDRPRFVPAEVAPSSRLGLRGRVGNTLADARQGIGAASENIGLAGSAIAGISLMEPIRQAAEFDNVLTHIAITAGATGDQVRTKVAEMSKTYRDMALAVNQSSHDIAESAQFLITTGIGEEMTNTLLPIIAKAATAYNTPMQDAVQGAFSIHEELGIAPQDMRGALSAAALAAKQGHFSFSDISAFLPSVAAQAATAGITGRSGLDSLLAALETSRRGAGSSGQAATNLQDFIGYINAPIGARAFAKSGIDLPGLLQNAEKQGVNPIEAVAAKLQELTRGMSSAQSATAMGKLFHNQEARIFIETLLREWQYYQDTKKKISGASDATIDEDFKKAQNLTTRLRTLSEEAQQLNQKIGNGFSWVVPIGSALLAGVLSSMSWLDFHVPGVTDSVIGLTGGMLGLVTTMGVLGAAMGPVKAGFLLMRGPAAALANPWVALFALIAAAAYDMYANWDKFRTSFQQVGAGIQQMMAGNFWNGTVQAWGAIWGKGGIMEKLFGDFAAWVDSWSDGLATRLGQSIHTMVEAGKTMLFGPADDRDHAGRAKPQAPGAASPGTGAPTGREDVPTYMPQRYDGPQPGAPQVIHIKFESDVPGRASVVESGSAQVRGPMLTRA